MKQLQLLCFTLLSSISHLYCADNNLEQIMLAIEAGDHARLHQVITPININAELPYFKSTPLDYAMQFPNANCAIILIKLGANVNMKCKHFKTPLHAAAYFNEPCIAQELLKAGALIKEKDFYGYTPLDIAKKYNCSQAIKVLEDWSNHSNIKEPNID